MADWSAIETALEAWVQDITGLSTYWEKRPSGRTFSAAGWAILSTSSRLTRGEDEIISEFDKTQPQGSQIRTYQSGQRTFVFGVQVRTSRQSVDQDARHYTSLLRDSTRWPTRTVAVLAAADIAIARIVGEAEFDERIDGREMSVAQLDILINATALAEDTATPWIETLEDATLQAPQGTDRWVGDLDLT